MGENSTGEAAEVQAGASNPVPAMASYFGRMDVFNPKEVEWLTYIERLEMFFVINSVPEDKESSKFAYFNGWKDVCVVKKFNNPD